jgi:hypothetical protein
VRAVRTVTVYSTEKKSDTMQLEGCHISIYVMKSSYTKISQYSSVRVSTVLTNLALSSTPAMIPAKNAAQLSCPMSAGTDT